MGNQKFQQQKSLKYIDIPGNWQHFLFFQFSAKTPARFSFTSNQAYLYVHLVEISSLGTFSGGGVGGEMKIKAKLSPAEVNLGLSLAAIHYCHDFVKIL